MAREWKLKRISSSGASAQFGRLRSSSSISRVRRSASVDAPDNDDDAGKERKKGGKLPVAPAVGVSAGAATLAAAAAAAAAATSAMEDGSSLFCCLFFCSLSFSFSFSLALSGIDHSSAVVWIRCLSTTITTTTTTIITTTTAGCRRRFPNSQVSCKPAIAPLCTDTTTIALSLLPCHAHSLSHAQAPRTSRSRAHFALRALRLTDDARDARLKSIRSCSS